MRKVPTVANPKNLSEAVIAKEFSRCDPRVTQAIKEVFHAFKRMAGGQYPEDKILKTAVQVCAGFEFNVSQYRRRSSPIIIPPSIGKA